MLRAARAIMNASRWSVFALPGYKSATRRIAKPGKISNFNTHGLGYCDSERADCCRLIHYDQYSIACSKLGIDLP